MTTRDRSKWKAALVGALLLVDSCATAMPRAAAGPAGDAHAAKAYVGLFKDSAVAVVDTGADRVLTRIPVPLGPHGLVITPDGRKVYVSSDGASVVSVIDTAVDRVVRSIEVGSTPHGLAMSPDGRQVLASVFGANEAVVIDTATDGIAGRIAVPQPHNSAIARDGRTAYVGSQQQGATALVIVDLVERKQIGRVPLDKAPRALAFDPAGKRLYFTVAGDDEIRVLDPARNRVVRRIAVGASPHHPLFTPDGRFALVVSQGLGELAILDPTSHAVAGTVTVGKAPHWIATSSDGRAAFVTNEGSGDISVVDLSSRTVTATIPVGEAPRKIAVQPGALSLGSDAHAVRPRLAGASAEPEPSDHGTQDVRGLTEIDLEADDDYFAPTYLLGAPGQKLRLEIENDSASLHNVTIPALRIDRDIPPQGKVEVEVTFPRAGAVPFFCKFHGAMGMAGALLVGSEEQRS